MFTLWWCKFDLAFLRIFRMRSNVLLFAGFLDRLFHSRSWRIWSTISFSWCPRFSPCSRLWSFWVSMEGPNQNPSQWRSSGEYQLFWSIHIIFPWDYIIILKPFKLKIWNKFCGREDLLKHFFKQMGPVTRKRPFSKSVKHCSGILIHMAKIRSKPCILRQVKVPNSCSSWAQNSSALYGNISCVDLNVLNLREQWLPSSESIWKQLRTNQQIIYLERHFWSELMQVTKILNHTLHLSI